MLCYQFRNLTILNGIKNMELQTIIPDIKNMIPYEYESIASFEYDTIINKYLNVDAKRSDPYLFHLCGLPGAGKTTFYHSQSWPKHVFIGFDDIMESIPQYQKDIITLGSVNAFKKWEIPARIIGYELFRRAVSEHKTIFFDNGALSQTHLNLIKNIRNFGYKTIMYYISCDIDTACQRAEQRQKETMRHIPVETIKQRALIEQDVVPQYKQIADEFYTYNNNKKSFQLIESFLRTNSEAV